MSNFGSPTDARKSFFRVSQVIVTDAINQVGESVSEALEVYMQTMFKVAWPIIGKLNKYGLHVRRHQMTTILSLAVPAVAAGVLGYAIGRFSRRG